MKRMLSWIANLKFGIKVGGGFLIILLLTAAVGAVGYLAIVNLSERFQVAGQSSVVAHQMQSASLQREKYLLNPGSESADETKSRIANLTSALDALSMAVRGDSDAVNQVEIARDAVEQFKTTFDEVIQETNTQADRLSTLQESTSNLQMLAATIKKTVDDKMADIKERAAVTDKALNEASGLLSSAAEFQDGAIKIKAAHKESGGTFFGDAMTIAKEIVGNIVANATALSEKNIQGIDPELLPKLLEAATTIDQSLDAIEATTDFKEKFKAQMAIGDAVNAVISATQQIQAETFPLVMTAMEGSSKASAELAKIGRVSGEAQQLSEVALRARTETLSLFGGFTKSDPALVYDAVADLSSLEMDLNDEIENLPEIGEQINQIYPAISTFNTAFKEMLATQSELFVKRLQLSQLTVEVSEKIDALTASQSTAAKSAASAAAVKIGIAILLAILGGIALAFGLNFVITRPIQAVTGVIHKLASGDNDVDIPGASRGDEIGIMAKAVQVLRSNAQEKVRVEQQAEADRVRGETERNQREQEKAAEAEKLQNAISALASALGRMASGDISTDIETRFDEKLDRLRVDFNAAQDHLRKVLTVVEQSADTIRNNTYELEGAAGNLSHRTEQQAASLEETAAALEQITQTVKISASQANEASEIAAKTSAATTRSTEVMKNAISAMDKIEQSSTKISQIISVMDDIAFQTNLLALNAGVEAARAGEAGKGFAVVAQEVRELAAKSASAAKEINALISASGDEIRAGVTLVTETGDTLSEIEQFVADMNKRISAITDSSREQSVSLSSVSSSVSTMDQMTQQNAAMVEETSAATTTLSGEAQRLHEGLAGFKLTGQAQRASAA